MKLQSVMTIAAVVVHRSHTAAAAVLGKQGMELGAGIGVAIVPVSTKCEVLSDRSARDRTPKLHIKHCHGRPCSSSPHGSDCCRLSRKPRCKSSLPLFPRKEERMEGLAEFLQDPLGLYWQEVCKTPDSGK